MTLGTMRTRTLSLVAPLLAEFLARRRRHAVPAGQAWRREDFVGQAARNGDLNVVLVGRQAAAAVNQLFEKGGRIVFAGVKERAPWRVPSSWRDGRARRIEDRMGASGIPDAETDKSSVENLRRHAAVPYLRRPRMSTISSAPNSL